MDLWKFGSISSGRLLLWQTMNGRVVAIVSLHVAWLLSTKWILSSGTGYGFMFPICLGCWHIGMCFMSMLWLLRSKDVVTELRALWKRQWKAMLAVGALLALDMMFQYSSLINQSLTMNQIIRCVLHQLLLPPFRTHMAGSSRMVNLHTKARPCQPDPACSDFGA